MTPQWVWVLRAISPLVYPTNNGGSWTSGWGITSALKAGTDPCCHLGWLETVKSPPLMGLSIGGLARRVPSEVVGQYGQRSKWCWIGDPLVFIPSGFKKRGFQRYAEPLVSS